MSPRFCAITWRAVLVESHEISRSSLPMLLVEIRRVCVVPVLLKLLTEDTFCCEFLLRNKKHVIEIIQARLITQREVVKMIKHICHLLGLNKNTITEDNFWC